MKKRKTLFIICFLVLISFLDSSSKFVSASESTTELMMITKVETADRYYQKLAISDDGNLVYAAGANAGANNFLYQYDFTDYDGDEAILGVDYTWRRIISGAEISTLSISEDGDVVMWGEGANDQYTYVDKENDLKWTNDFVDIKTIVVSGDGEYYLAYYTDVDQYIGVFPVDFTSGWQTSFAEFVYCMDIAHDGSFFSFGLNNGTVRTYTKYGTLLWEDTPTLDTEPSDIKISDNGKYVIVNGLHNSEIYLYNSTNGDLLQTYTPGMGSGYSHLLGVSSSGEEILVSTTSSASGDILCLYSPTNSTPVWSLDSDDHWTYRGGISDDGALAFCGTWGTSTFTGNYLLVDCTNGIVLVNETLIDHYVAQAEISGDGTTGAFLGSKGDLFIFRINVTESTPESEPSLLDDILGTFTNTGGLIALASALVLGLIIGPLIFRRRK